VHVRVGADTFFDPDLDPVTVAVAVFGGNHDDRRLWRWYLYRIGEDEFRQLAFTQWRENRSDENGDLFDYGDCNRAARRMFRELDAPVHEHFRRLRLRQALYKLRKYPELQATLKAIYKYRFLPRQFFSALKIKGEMYRKRLSDLTQILKIST
jgi:hypothetical protein